MSKMGISTIRSYRGAKIFEAVGLGEGLLKTYFGTPCSTVGGIGLKEIARDYETFHRRGYAAGEVEGLLPHAGLSVYRKDGERHAWNPETIATLQLATRTGSYARFKEFTAKADTEGNPVFLRDFFRFRKNPIDISKVEPVEEIVRHFVTGAISFGAISKEAHEALALAMNKLGARSNTGEGGEDSARFHATYDGIPLSSKTKQVASGRFGVTAEYLVNAEEIQIKVAQGAKPGEGGQLPGFKVDEVIARTRHSIPGISLISPPPHHDIYSIEDLAQLVFDLKNVNPKAYISVKLVAESGVGTIAAGVAKAKADLIVISGAEGGTGASPASSVRYAEHPARNRTKRDAADAGDERAARTGAPADRRAAEDGARCDLYGAAGGGRVCFRHGGAHRAGLCDDAQVSCQHVPGGGGHAGRTPAPPFQGTLRVCGELFPFPCPRGARVSGGDGLYEAGRHRGPYRPDRHCAGEGREGCASLDFSRLLHKVDNGSALHHVTNQHHDIDHVMDVGMIAAAKEALEHGKEVSLEYAIANTDRSVGAMLSGGGSCKVWQRGTARPDHQREVQGLGRTELRGVSGSWHQFQAGRRGE